MKQPFTSGVIATGAKRMKAIYLGVKADWPETFFWKERPAKDIL